MTGTYVPGAVPQQRNAIQNLLFGIGVEVGRWLINGDFNDFSMMAKCVKIKKPFFIRAAAADCVVPSSH